MTDWVGQTLSKVLIEKRIARGGMAEVYSGRHTTLNRACVVKILYAHLSEDPRLIIRFHTEAQAIAALRHPNIVQVFDFDVADGRPYMVMELLEGISLETHLLNLRERDQLMYRREVVRLTEKLAKALDYAHSEGVLHRDIKPSNVMVCNGSSTVLPGQPLPPDFEPVLTDFGLARISFGSDHTAPGTIMGTPAYMSPEQVEGGAVDERSDIYALGAMTYETLAGKLPFGSSESTPASIMYQQVHSPTPPLPNAGPELSRVMERALAKDPDERPGTAGELVEDLKSAIRADADTTLTKPKSRVPFRILYAGLGLLLLGGLAFISIGKIWDSGVLPELSSTPTPVSTTAPTERPPAVREGLAPGAPTPPAFPEEDVRSGLDLSSPDYFNTFMTSSDWYLYDIEDSAAYRIEDGHLIGTDYVPEETFTWWSWLGRQSGNVYAEVSVTNGDCIGRDSVGMAVRVDEESAMGGYGLEISCDGFWRLRLHHESKSPRDLAEWSHSEMINTGLGATNRLGLMAFQGNFVVFINDQLVGTVAHPDYNRSFGNFALYVRASQTYDLTATFDDFAFWHVRTIPDAYLQ